MRILMATTAVALCLCACALAGDQARILKVLPQLLDKAGQNSRLPGLLDRDVYQANLRKNPGEVGGMQFAVQWRVRQTFKKPVVLRLEVIGLSVSNQPVSIIIEQQVKSRGFLGMGQWSYFKIGAEEYRKLNVISAWHVSLLSDSKVLAEQRSFLW